MLEKDFFKSCENTLSELCQMVEVADKNSKLDVEYSDGILTIIVEASEETYIINRHAASQKIWYSSPLSGADYFSFEDVSKKWLDAKGEELAAKLFSELKTLI
jgi:iron donor protein CyaY